MAESKWTRHEVQFRGVPNGGGRCNDHVTRAVKPRDVNKRAWMACHVLRIGTTTQGSRPSPTLAFTVSVPSIGLPQPRS